MRGANRALRIMYFEVACFISSFTVEIEGLERLEDASKIPKDLFAPFLACCRSSSRRQDYPLVIRY